MNITAAMVKELRERTGSGMMECKKALVESQGDLELAIEHMRKSGLAKADKKASRIAAEGNIFFTSSKDAKTVVMIEINCETDFVAKGDDFNDFAQAVGEVAVNREVDGVEALMQLQTEAGTTLENARLQLIAKIGENINVRRFVRYQAGSGSIGSYLHGSRIGVLVQLDGGDEQLGKDIAMHIAASKPDFVNEADVSAEVLQREREIYLAQAQDSGKPAAIIEKMVEGRLKKYLGEVTLLGQPFVKDPDIKVDKLLKDNKARVLRFNRFEVGEGIEKKSENFADEVMAQVKGH